MAWTKTQDQDCSIENRGWKKGAAKKFPVDIVERIRVLRNNLVADPDEFYVGDLAIQQAYEKQHGKPIPGIDYINKILRNEGLSMPHKKKRRGVAKYLCYPVECVKRLGERIAEIDFIGQKYIKGSSKPLHFLSVAYQNPRRLRKIKRTKSELTNEAIVITEETFNELGWPHAVRLDAGNPFTGRGERTDGKGARSIPRFASFLLEHQIIPVFGAIRSPWNQPHVEGSNSVFGKNFWNQSEFSSIKEVDERLDKFNECSKKRAKWKPWKRMIKKTLFIPRVCFIRKVGEDARKKKGIIPVASTWIILPKAYIGLFVFAEWNLKEEVLKIYFEKEEKIILVKQLPFPIHPRSRERCTHFLF